MGSRWYNIPSESESLKNASVWGQEKMYVPVQTDCGNSHFLHLFVLFGTSWNWVMPTHIEEAMGFAQFFNPNASPFGSILTEIPRNNLLPTIWASLSPGRLTHKFNYHSLGPEIEKTCSSSHKPELLTLGLVFFTCTLMFY